MGETIVFPPTSTESPIGGTASPSVVENTFAPTTTETIVFPPTSTEPPIGGTDAPTFLDIPPTQYPTERPPTPYPTEAPPTPHPTESPPTAEPTVTPPTPHPTQKAPTPYPTGTPPTPYPTESPPTSNTTGLELSEEKDDEPKATVSPTKAPKCVRRSAHHAKNGQIAVLIGASGRLRFAFRGCSCRRVNHALPLCLDCCLREKLNA